VDPNDHDLITMDRGQKWFLDTWYKYVATKYRRRVPGRSVCVVITKVTEPVRALMVTRIYNAR
jgi:hypothetical protein